MTMNTPRDRIELLQHLLRVSCGKQWLFNSFNISVEQLRRYNSRSDVVLFTLEKVKLIYDMQYLTSSDLVNEKVLYQLNERLKVLFTNVGRPKTVLDPHALTVSLIDLLIRVCEVCQKSETRTVSMLLVDSIEKLIDTGFIKPYCKGLLHFGSGLY